MVNVFLLFELIFKLTIVLVELVLFIGTDFSKQVVDFFDFELNLIDDGESDNQEYKVEQ